MAEPPPGQTRETLALLFFNSIAAKEKPEGQLDRAYALDLLADVIAAIDGKRAVAAPAVAAAAQAVDVAEEPAALPPKRPPGRPKKTPPVAVPARRGRRPS